MNIYYVTVKFLGNVYVPPVIVNDTVPNVTVVAPVEVYVPDTVNFTIVSFNWHSIGSINFTSQVNT